MVFAVYLPELFLAHALAVVELNEYVLDHVVPSEVVRSSGALVALAVDIEIEYDVLHRLSRELNFQVANLDNIVVLGVNEHSANDGLFTNDCLVACACAGSNRSKDAAILTGEGVELLLVGLVGGLCKIRSRGMTEYDVETVSIELSTGQRLMVVVSGDVLAVEYLAALYELVEIVSFIVNKFFVNQLANA